MAQGLQIQSEQFSFLVTAFGILGRGISAHVRDAGLPVKALKR